MGMTNDGTGNFYIGAGDLFSSGNRALTISSSKNIGIGTNPSAWSTANSVRAIQNPAGSIWNFVNGNMYMALNYYWDGSNRRYVNSGVASEYQQSGDHSFYTAPSGSAGNVVTFTERMRITSGGNVGIGTPSPSALLHLGVANAAVDGTKGVKITNPAGTTVMLECGVSSDSFVGTTSASDFSIRTGNSERMRIISSGIILIGKTTTSLNTTAGTRIDTNGVSYWQIPNNEETLYVWDSSNQTYRFKVNGSGTVFATNTTISSISDERLKENIKDLDVGLDAIMALRPRKYDWKVQSGNSGKNVRGFIAQEVETIFPDLIDEWKNKDDNENAITYKSLRQDFIPILVKAIQELNQKVENQQQTINSLINR